MTFIPKVSSKYEIDPYILIYTNLGHLFLLKGELIMLQSIITIFIVHVYYWRKSEQNWMSEMKYSGFVVR